MLLKAGIWREVQGRFYAVLSALFCAFLFAQNLALGGELSNLALKGVSQKAKGTRPSGGGGGGGGNCMVDHKTGLDLSQYWPYKNVRDFPDAPMVPPGTLLKQCLAIFCKGASFSRKFPRKWIVEMPIPDGEARLRGISAVLGKISQCSLLLGPSKRWRHLPEFLLAVRHAGLG